MNTAPDFTPSTTTAAIDPTKAGAAPRIKLQSHGFAIDHPDQELGERLMADTLGVADREAMHGIIRQLVKASVSGESPDEVNLAFMISMVKSIKPRDSIEAMLVAQMVSVHVMAWHPPAPGRRYDPTISPYASCCSSARPFPSG